MRVISHPDLAALRAAAVVFNGYANVDRSWHRLRADTGGALDLGRPEHRALVLRWLNSWGCRIRYPRDGEPSVFDPALETWWHTHGGALPGTALAALTDPEIDRLAAAFDGLAGLPVSTVRPVRALGPTAAAKAMYALRPDTVMPWDAAIATTLHRGRDGAAFGRHLRLGREWAVAVLAESGLAADGLPAHVGRPAIPLPKLLDEYLYLAITRAEAPGTD